MSDSVTTANTGVSEFSGFVWPADELVTYEGYGLVHKSEQVAFESSYTKCHVRGTWHEQSEMRYTADGTWICEDEFQDNWFVSSHDGGVHPRELLVVVRSENGRSQDVTIGQRDAFYFMCGHYSEYYPRASRVRTGDGTYVSRRAVDNYYSCCQACDEYFRHDDLDDDGECSGCAGSASGSDVYRIRDYCDRGYPAPLGEGRLYGVENEVEIRNGRRDALARSVIDSLGKDFAILKSDGSLDNGFEIVTAPATLEHHTKRWKQFCTPDDEGKYPWHGLRSAKTETCGLHVHVTRKALKSSLHLGRILVFMNEPTHRKFIEAIARRSETDWCRIYKKKLSEGKNQRGSGDKYVAVNLNHTETIEFRIFKGTLTYRHFMSSLQFVDALIDFTSPATTGLTELTPAKFAEFVKASRKTWPYLANELVAMGALPKEAAVAIDKKPDAESPTAEVTPSKQVILTSEPYKEHISPVYVKHEQPKPPSPHMPRPARTSRSGRSAPATIQLEPQTPSRPTLPAWGLALANRRPGRDAGPTDEEVRSMIRLREDDVICRGDWLPGAAEWAYGVVGTTVAEFGGEVWRYCDVLELLRSRVNPWAGIAESTHPGPDAFQRSWMRSLHEGEVRELGDYMPSYEGNSGGRWVAGLAGEPVSRDAAVSTHHSFTLRLDSAALLAYAVVTQ